MKKFYNEAASWIKDQEIYSEMALSPKDIGKSLIKKSIGNALSPDIEKKIIDTIVSGLEEDIDKVIATHDESENGKTIILGENVWSNAWIRKELLKGASVISSETKKDLIDSIEKKLIELYKDWKFSFSSSNSKISVNNNAPNSDSGSYEFKVNLQGTRLVPKD